jgi:hypothetical protein
MKSFKELRKTINESSYPSAFDAVGTRGRVGPQDSDNSLEFGRNLADLSRQSIARINTYLGALGAKPYINPMEALKQAQGRLQMVGLDFHIPKDFCTTVEESETTNTFPLTRFGGTLRSDGTTYGYEMDDGITPVLGHGLMMQVETQRLTNGLIQVQAMVVPST